MQASSASSSIQVSSEQLAPSSSSPVTLGQTDEAEGVDALAHTDFPDVPLARVDLPRVSELPPSNPEVESQAFAEAEERADAERPPPEWCVDLGSSILAMTTFELWMALARGDVDGKTSVWRNGMDNWENVEDIPELAYALTDSLSLAPPPVIPTPTEVISVRTNDPTPLGFGTTDMGTEESLELRPVPLPVRGFSFGQAKAAFAAMFVAAAAAVGLSVLPKGAGESAQAERSIAVARLHSAMERANRQVVEAAQRRAETEAERAVAPVSSSARQHKEVGQRRSRRGRH